MGGGGVGGECERAIIFPLMINQISPFLLKRVILNDFRHSWAWRPPYFSESNQLFLVPICSSDDIEIYSGVLLAHVSLKNTKITFNLANFRV